MKTSYIEVVTIAWRLFFENSVTPNEVIFFMCYGFYFIFFFLCKDFNFSFNHVLFILTILNSIVI